MKHNHWGPVPVAELYDPSIIIAKWWPRVWTFKCGGCSEKVSRFGWWGYAKCPYCRQVNAPRWQFGNSGY